MSRPSQQWHVLSVPTTSEKMHSTTDINSFLANIAQGPSTVFAVFFAFSGVLHAWQSRKYRSWAYTWTLPCACILMTAGFICREIVAYKHDADDLASAVQGTFYSAICVFAVPIYMFLFCPPVGNELLPWINQTISHVIIWTFTSAVITCVSHGCAIYFNPAGKPSAVSAALALLKASFFLQLALNGAVLCLLALVMGIRRKKGAVEDNGVAHHQTPWTLVISSFALLLLLVVRNVFRTIQAFAPATSDIWTNEAYFWVFEAAVMVCFSVVLHVQPPAKNRSWGYMYDREQSCG